MFAAVFVRFLWLRGTVLVPFSNGPMVCALSIGICWHAPWVSECMCVRVCSHCIHDSQFSSGWSVHAWRNFHITAGLCVCVRICVCACVCPSVVSVCIWMMLYVCVLLKENSGTFKPRALFVEVFTVSSTSKAQK